MVRVSVEAAGCKCLDCMRTINDIDVMWRRKAKRLNCPVHRAYSAYLARMDLLYPGKIKIGVISYSRGLYITERRHG